MVLVSSAKVMGEGQDGPYVETDAPQPSDGYAWSKLAGEKALERVGAETGMQWVILRPPGLRPHRRRELRARDCLGGQRYTPAIGGD